MATLSWLRVSNYRSIEGPLEIVFPPRTPVVLLGENNVGKSNIVKALNLLLGNFWPGTHDPDDHEFFLRDRTRTISVGTGFASEDLLGGRYEEIRWEFPHPEGEDGPLYRGFPDRFRGYIKATDRDTCVCVVLEAERNLSYQLSYASKYTLLSKLMHKFHRALLEQETTRNELEQLFASIKDKFRQIPAFAAFTGRLQAHLQDLLGTMTHRLEVDFEAYNPTNFFHALRLHAQEQGNPRTLDEMGTGEQQILALCFAHAFAEAFHGGIVLVVEEPESHLHPLAQQWLASRLTSLCEGGLQILLTTHSPSFVDLLRLEGLVLVQKEGGTKSVQITRQILAETCVRLGVPRERSTPERILPFYRSAVTPQLLEGFFAKLVVLVEGPTESLSVPSYLRKLGMDNTKEGIAFLPVHGKGNLAKWRRLFEAFGIPVYLMFDNDPEDDEAGNKRADALRSLGIDPAEIPNLTERREWIVQDRFTIFGPQFEGCLQAHFQSYESLEASAREHGADGKPLVARWVAENMPLAEEVGWQRFRDIISRLRRLLPQLPA